MATWRGRLLAVIGAALGAGWMGVAVSQAPGSDQVIVKFTSHSAAGQTLARIDLEAIADPATDARLAEIADALGERLGIPVRLESLTSGRELLIALDREALTSALAERLRQRDGVTGVAEPGGDTDAPLLEVEFEPESAFAEHLGEGARVALGPLAGEGEHSLEVEAVVQSLGDHSAVLALDHEALTAALLERLQADPDVQYAQRNLQLQPYEADAAAPS